MGYSRPTLLRKLKGFDCKPQKVRLEGKCKPLNFYEISTLPSDWQRRIFFERKKKLEEEQEAEEEHGKALVPVNNALVKLPGKLPAVFCKGIPRNKADNAHMKYLLIRGYRDFLEHGNTCHGSKLDIQEQFILAYNLGEEGLFPDIFKAVGRISKDTLYRWIRELKASGNDPHILADARGYHRRGATKVNNEQMKVLIAIMLSPNRLKVSEGIRIARTRWQERGITADPCDKTYRNAVNIWRRNNYPQWVFCREGWKALNEECLMHIDRDYSRIKVGDIVSADGHRFNLQIIDPWSGKPRRMTLTLFEDMKSGFPLGWDITRNENTASITTAYYRACITLGKIPRVVHCDNGKAFRKRVFNSISDFRQQKFVSLLEKCGSKNIFAWPWHGESKTVERLNGIIGEFERACLSYSGSSIETKPARMKRNEKLHAQLYEAITGGRFPTVEEVHEGLTGWFEDYINRPKSGRLKGKTPLEVFLAGRGPGLTDEELFQLKINLLPSVVRTIQRDGIKMPSSVEKYYHEKMFGKKDHHVEVRYDPYDHSSILVFDRHGEFLYEAGKKPLVHPAAGPLGTDEDREELKHQIEIKRRQAKSVTGPLRELLDKEIMPESRRIQTAIGFGAGALPRLPKPAEAEKPAQENWMDFAVNDDALRASEDQERRIASMMADYEHQKQVEFQVHLENSGLARRFAGILRLSCQGKELNEEQSNDSFIYRNSEEYRNHRQQWEELTMQYRNVVQEEEAESPDSPRTPTTDTTPLCQER